MAPTKLARVPVHILDDLSAKFPNMKKGALFEIMYNTSLLKMESILRAPSKKKDNMMKPPY